MIDSSGTFIAAYVLVAVIFVGYSLSLWLRAQHVANLRHPATRPGSE
jgi:hypothetical protein